MWCVYTTLNKYGSSPDMAGLSWCTVRKLPTTKAECIYHTIRAAKQKKLLHFPNEWTSDPNNNFNRNTRGSLLLVGATEIETDWLPTE